MNLTQFALEILDVQDENKRLRKELARALEFEEKYYQLQKDSVAHAETMLWNLIQSEMKNTRRQEKRYILELTNLKTHNSNFYLGIMGQPLSVPHMSYARHFKSVEEARDCLRYMANFKPIIRVVEDGVLTEEIV